MVLYLVNKQVTIITDTAVRFRENVKVKDTVKQFTVFGPKLFCINVARVNHVKTKEMTIITPEIVIEAFAYGDNIIGKVSKTNKEKIGANSSKKGRKGKQNEEKDCWCYIDNII